MIAGGDLTAARAIKSHRHEGGPGRIALRSKERDLPYHRPALSKRYLRDETIDAPFAEDAAFYRDQDVEVLLETTPTAVHAHSRTVTTDLARFQYDKLLIATGATPRRLRVPEATLEGIYELRTLRDSQAIGEAAIAAEHVVVVGGGFIGREVAASLRQLGLAVTLIHPRSTDESLAEAGGQPSAEAKGEARWSAITAPVLERTRCARASACERARVTK